MVTIYINSVLYANVAVPFVSSISANTDKFRMIIATSSVSSSLCNMLIYNYRDVLIILPKCNLISE
jgi:hypothetical protein